MGRAYALVVGINAYRAPMVTPLYGCHNDVEHAKEFLGARLDRDLRPRVLRDAEASRQAVIDGFRDHLAAAGAGDLAIFWFSGHGSEQLVAEKFRHLEPGGYNQTLVCADSRTGDVPDLADKELSVLIDAVAAKAGHTIVVLDCCNSGGGTREPFVSFRGIARSETAPAWEAYLPELQEPAAWAGAAGPRAPYVALSACRSFEKAREQKLDGQVRGLFTTSLLAALERLGAGATYRDVLAATRSRVENATGDQSPELYPVDLGGIADQPFLGGAVTRPAAGFVMQHGRDGWAVDAGRCHGVVPETDGDAVRFQALPPGDGLPGGPARATAVEAARSLVEPEGWQPDPERPYRVRVDRLPRPPAAVVLGGLPEDDAGALKLVADAIAARAPFVRVVAPDAERRGLRLRVGAVCGAFQIRRGDGSAATAEVPGHTPESAQIVAARLDHIAQWAHIKELDNPATALAGAVAIEIVAAQPGETLVPFDRPPLVPDEHGQIRLAYTRTPAAWEPPSIFIRLRNTTDRQLWCVLLDLTDRYRVHPKLFPGAFVGPRQVGVALEGAPVPATLPPGRAVEPGASGRDWFKLIVSEREVSTLAYELPRLDEPPARDAPPGQARDVPGGDWTTAIVPLLTEVPA